jgi:catechol 2,3-dioxygenase-like lactoylglutathione lyase family enzyme/predicted enzyme related to lactoylglutathione lyase
MNASRIAVTGVRAIELGLSDPARAARFFTEVWRLKRVEECGDRILLRGSSSLHHVVSVEPSRGPAHVRRIVFDARDHRSVDALQKRVAQWGGPCEEARALDRPGGGYGFGFQDPCGRAMAVIAQARDSAIADDDPLGPLKITHVNLNTPSMDEMTKFLTEALDLRLVDEAGPQRFFNADTPDHCSVVLCRGPQDTLNHIAFELKDLETVMRGAGRMIDNGYPIEWGPGRHGPGNNCFAYFAGPDELPLEYTSDVLQIDDRYEFHGPEHWKWPAGRLDHWGITPPHTARWKRIQTLVGFATDDYRLV